MRELLPNSDSKVLWKRCGSAQIAGMHWHCVLNRGWPLRPARSFVSTWSGEWCSSHRRVSYKEAIVTGSSNYKEFFMQLAVTALAFFLAADPDRMEWKVDGVSREALVYSPGKA